MLSPSDLAAICSRHRNGLLSLIFLSGGASAQQFTYQPGLLAGSVWSEGVESVDVDADGDLDLLVADGTGFASAGQKLQNRLHINQFAQTGSLSFLDESVARLGVSLSHARGITTGDVDGDGWVDILVANGFNTDPPFLFINRGAAQPGFFDQESALRGLTEPLNSAGAQFGDVDDDGDLDIVICDSGQSYLGGAGDEPRLYRNDGQGSFTWDTAAIPGPPKNSQMDVQLVDVDGDFDLDLFLPCRGNNSGNNHYLMLNDGSGLFSDVSSTLPTTSSSVYEAEVGDLDGDDDLDLFFVSLSGFREGHVENELNPSGNLSWTAGAAQSPSVDDNEIVLVDYDSDGDYDVLVGSLSSREYLWENQGGLSWTSGNANIQAVTDSTLDATAADLDNDGDYDLVTAQGESNQGQFVNKVYLNSGAPDDLPPVVVATDFQSPQSLAWPLAVHARVRDQVVDDGVNYVTASGWAAPAGGSAGTVVYGGGVFNLPSLNVQAGQSLVLDNQSGATQLFEFLGPVESSIELFSNSLYERGFAAPGSYTLQAGGATLPITVTGPAAVVPGLAMGGQQFRFAIPQMAVGLFGEVLLDTVYEDWPGNQTYLINQFVPASLGDPFCVPASGNSSGQAGLLTARGSASVVANDMVLVATRLPVNQFGYFVTGMGAGPPVIPPGSQGRICLTGSVGRYNQSVMNSGASGLFELSIDLGAMPLNPAVPAVAGQTWHFQAWHRDVLLVPTSNFTEGRSILMQ